MQSDQEIWVTRRSQLIDLLRLPDVSSSLIAHPRRTHLSPVDLNTLYDVLATTSFSNDSALHVAQQTAARLALQPLTDFKTVRTLVKTPQSSVAVVTSKTSNTSAVTLIRKSISKKWASRMQGQSSPRIERSILLKANKESRLDVPKLFCTLQDSDDLFIYIEYAPLGTLWLLIESSPLGRLSTDLVTVWTAEAIEALHWLHRIGYVHRDVKPHNMLLCAKGHLKLTDFGSAAPLINTSKGLRVPKEYCACVVGTIDYIGPEILIAHQDAIEAADSSDETICEGERLSERVGNVLDWWSLAVTVYELLSGQAPFFAESVADTCDRILNFKTNLSFDGVAGISSDAASFIISVLVEASDRPDYKDLVKMNFFRGVDWSDLRSTPIDLDLLEIGEQVEANHSSVDESLHAGKAFDFSAFFSSPGLSALRVDQGSFADHGNEWLGFTYLPAADIFNDPTFHSVQHIEPHSNGFKTPARNPAQPKQIGTTARKRRPVTELEAFVEVVEYGVRSARKRATASPEDGWQSLQSRQKAILQQLDQLQDKVHKLGHGR